MPKAPNVIIARRPATSVVTAPSHRKGRATRVVPKGKRAYFIEKIISADNYLAGISPATAPRLPRRQIHGHKCSVVETDLHMQYNLLS